MSPITPTLRSGVRTAKDCHSSRYKPAARISSSTTASASRRVASRSRVIVPITRTARPGKRLAPDHVLGQAKLQAHFADLVLEQVAQRLDQLEGHVLGQTTDVVM